MKVEMSFSDRLILFEIHFKIKKQTCIFDFVRTFSYDLHIDRKYVKSSWELLERTNAYTLDVKAYSFYVLFRIALD